VSRREPVEAFLDVARQAVVRKPVVLIKGGVTGAGARSSVSHTGSLAGEARVMSAAMEQAGVVLVDRLDEVVPVVDALSRLPLPKGRRVAVVGGGGGHATLCADALEKAGLEVPTFSEATRKEISAHLPARAGMGNPVDFTGASEREIAVYAKVPEITLAQDADAVLLYGLYAGYRTDLERPGNTYVDTSRMIVDMVRRTGKPAIMQTVYASRDHPSLAVLREGDVPVMQSVEHAAAGLAALSRYAEYRSRAEHRTVPVAGRGDLLAPEIAARGRARPAANLTEAESLAILAQAGIPLVPHRAVEGRAAAVAAAADIGYPVVLKALDPALVHKSDTGGVALDLRDETSLCAAFDQVSAATGSHAVLVASFRPGGLELIVGGYRDANFGAVLVFGLGGTAVEALDDVTLRVLPINREEAATMLTGFRGHRLLGPLRGKAGVDREALIDILVGVGALLHANPDIAEIDLNPVLAFPEGALVADARMVLARDATEGGRR
jgi:acetate---CoA ligase (ADP-forming)